MFKLIITCSPLLQSLRSPEVKDTNGHRSLCFTPLRLTLLWRSHTGSWTYCLVVYSVNGGTFFRIIYVPIDNSAEKTDVHIHSASLGDVKINTVNDDPLIIYSASMFCVREQLWWELCWYGVNTSGVQAARYLGYILCVSIHVTSGPN